MNNKFFRISKIVVLLTISLVILSYLAFYFIDLRNVFGLRDFLFATEGSYFFFSYRPFFFQHWGRDGGIAEVFQWFFLGTSALVAMFSATKMHSKKRGLFMFWFLMSIAFVLMLIEDAGNIRHLTMSYVQWIFDEPDQGVMGTLAEFLVFSAIGGIPLYAIVRYWNDIKSFTKTKLYLLLGFVFYGLAVSFSFLGTAFEGILPVNLYTFIGKVFYDFAISLGDQNVEKIWAESSFNIEFFLMDSLFEENLELLGSGLLLAACISFLHYSLKKKF